MRTRRWLLALALFLCFAHPSRAAVALHLGPSLGATRPILDAPTGATYGLDLALAAVVEFSDRFALSGDYGWQDWGQGDGLAFQDPASGAVLASDRSEWSGERALVTARIGFGPHDGWNGELLLGTGLQRFRVEAVGGVQPVEDTTDWQGEIHGGLGLRLFDDSRQSLRAELVLQHAMTEPELGTDTDQVVLRLTLLRRVVDR